MYMKRTPLNTFLSSCCFLATAVLASQAASAATYTVATGSTVTEPTLLSGTGDVEVTGGGTLALTNTTNTYSGGTLVYGGSILQINNNGELGATAGTLTLGNATTTGTLQFSAATTLPSTRLITLAAGGATIDSGAFNNTVAGVISGTGSLITVGGGTTGLTLSGTNTYTGATTVSAGSVLTLSGTNAILTSSKVTANGTLALASNESIVSLAGTGTVNVGTKTLTITTGADTFSGTLTGTTGGLAITTQTAVVGGITNYLTGSVATLSGTVNYTGATAISAGSTLYLTNTASLANSSGVAIAGTVSVSATNNGSVAGVLDVSGVTGGAVSLKTLTSAGNLVLGANNLTVTAGSGSYTGIISGTGSVTLGAGSWTIGGANTYTGATTLNTGTTLTISGGGLASASIVNNGTINVTGGTSLNGIISGTGSVNVTAANATLAVTGANTYTGATTVAAGGTLQIGAGGTIGSVPTATITDNGIVAFNRSDNLVLANIITGSGVLQQMGRGTLTIYNTNTYTGGTVITAGTVQVGDDTHTTVVLPGSVTVGGGTLAGRGTIAGNVTNIAGGTVNTGGSLGTLTINGNYTQATGSNLAVEVATTGASLLQVNGAASLTGGTVKVTVDPGTYKAMYVPILKGALTISAASTSSYSITGDAASTVVAGFFVPGGTLGTTSITATEVDLVIVPKASGQIYGNIVTASLDSAVALNDIALDHTAFESCTAKPGAKGSECHGASVWARAIGGASHMKADNGAAAFGTTTWGAIGGVDYRFNNEGSLHAIVGYTTGKLSVGGGYGFADRTGLFTAVAGHASGPIIALDADAFYASNSSDVSRASGFGQTLTATVNNIIAGFSFQASAPLLGGDVVPLAKVTYGFLTYGGFSESGNANVNLTGKHAKESTAVFDLGVRLSHPYAMDSGWVLRPSLLLAAEDNATYGSPAVTMSMASSLGNTFVAPAQTEDRVAGLVRLNFDAKLSDALNVQVGFDGRISKSQQQVLFNLGASYRF